jgi:UDP-glucose 6-dehydrogenase
LAATSVLKRQSAGGTERTDIRKSPALLLVQALLQEGSKVTAYDPAAMGRTQEVMNSGITFVNSPYKAAQPLGAFALLETCSKLLLLRGLPHGG